MEKRILQLALETLQKQKEEIEAEIAALGGRIAGKSGERKKAATATSRGGRRTMSAAQRRAVSKRMKAYWAKRKGAPPK